MNRVLALIVLALLSTAAHPQSLAQRAQDAGCADRPEKIGSSLWSCKIASGAKVFFNCSDCDSTQPRREVRLLCEVYVGGGQYRFVNVVIDYEQSTVNGVAAKIDAGAITWSTPAEPRHGRKAVVNHELNRYAGTYTSEIATEGTTPAKQMVYACREVSARRF